MLARRYYRNEYIFFRPGLATDYLCDDLPGYRCDYRRREQLRDTVRSILASVPLEIAFRDLDRDVSYIMREVRDRVGGRGDFRGRVGCAARQFNDRS